MERELIAVMNARTSTLRAALEDCELAVICGYVPESKWWDCEYEGWCSLPPHEDGPHWSRWHGRWFSAENETVHDQDNTDQDGEGV